MVTNIRIKLSPNGFIRQESNNILTTEKLMEKKRVVPNTAKCALSSEWLFIWDFI